MYQEAEARRQVEIENSNQRSRSVVMAEWGWVMESRLERMVEALGYQVHKVMSAWLARCSEAETELAWEKRSARP